jgi:TRAP-type C4-dicarboxylate transport system substrate-binding protein
MASKVRFDTLTPKEQEVIRETVKEIQPGWRKLVAEKSIENRKICEQRGLKVNEIDYPAFRKAMEPVYTEFREKIGAEFADKVIKAASA